MSKYITKFFRLSNDVFREGVCGHNIDDPLSRVVFGRSYAKGLDETWGECSVRVIEGCMSILLTHCHNNNLWFDDGKWNGVAENMVRGMIDGKWCPAGRHLSNMGTDLVTDGGALYYNNCSAITTRDGLTDSALTMYEFMYGQAGVGFDTLWEGGELYGISEEDMSHIVVDDGMTIVRDVLSAYEYGLPLMVYGGFANGRLEMLYKRLVGYCEAYVRGEVGRSRLIVDVMNSIGVFISGDSVRSGAQIALGSPYDDEFINLKNYECVDDRSDIGWASNNSVVFDDPDDFLMIPKIADLIENYGEPGIINGINCREFGRLGRETETIEIDDEVLTLGMSENVWLTNPCGEISLQPYELCNLVTTVPIRCESFNEWYDMVRLATLYSSIASLGMTDNYESNKVIARNRKIGVSIAGMAEWFDSCHTSQVIGGLKKGYGIVRETNARFARSMGIPIAKKVTCIKPDGNLSLLLGVTPGIHWPPFRDYCIRRIRIGKKEPIVRTLNDIPYEESETNSDQWVFEFPYRHSDKVRSVKDLSIWEQLRYNEIVQRFWADNNVSFTGRFIKGVDNLENIISVCVPWIKTISFLEQDDEELKKKYAQLPYEEIDEVEWTKRMMDLL